jgi:uncharacterized protein
MVTLHLPECRSLKDKRRIVQSILTRLRQKHRVAASEVAEQSVWNRAVLGCACVANSQTQAREIMTGIVDWIAQHWDVDVADNRIEIFD